MVPKSRAVQRIGALFSQVRRLERRLPNVGPRMLRVSLSRKELATAHPYYPQQASRERPFAWMLLSCFLPDYRKEAIEQGRRQATIPSLATV